jgi:hypothetical protein
VMSTNALTTNTSVTTNFTAITPGVSNAASKSQDETTPMCQADDTRNTTDAPAVSSD